MAQIFPVRHHSPSCSRELARQIRAARPRLILVEGPSDAGPLIPLLLAADTRPPVAILAYLSADALGVDEQPRSVSWPFCAYSPEYVSLHIGTEVGAEVRFFDLPAGAFLERPEPTELPDPETPDVWRAIAERFGFDSYEELWECRFEMAAPGDSMAEAMLELGALVREISLDEYTRRREAWMRAEIARASAEGFGPEQMFVVCGAAHAPALQSLEPGAPFPEISARTANLALIPYSYPRLSEQSGYGAGNRAPAYYQSVWEMEGDFGRASRQALIRLADALHQAGYAISLADAIEANRLALTLSILRDKAAPGLNEVRDAAQACYGRGAVAVDGTLWPQLVGEAVGAVSSQVTRTSLQQEFYDSLVRLGLPLVDTPREHYLYLNQPADVEASVFMHRLIAAQIPFGRPAAVQMVGRGPTGVDTDDPARWLSQLREKWTLQWTPLTDIRLVESTVMGNTLAEVCTRLFRQQLAQPGGAARAAGTFLRIVLARLEPLYAEGLAACERASSTDDSLPALAQAAYALHSLVKYGSSRRVAAQAIETLMAKIFVRACLLLPGAVAVADDDVPALRQALISLNDVARQSPALDAQLLAGRLRLAAEASQVHPLLAGLACTLLFLNGIMPEAELTTMLSQRLSPGTEPLVAAQFIEGLLALNRTVLLRNQPVVGWLNDYLQAVPAERFVAVLPVLRRAFADLAPAETDYFLATLARILGLEGEQAKAGSRPPVDAEEIKAIDEELGGLLDDL